MEASQGSISTFGQRMLWAILWLTAFYFLGCVVFTHLEREAELETYAENAKLYEKMKELYSFSHCKDPAFHNLAFCRDQETFSHHLKGYFNQHGNSIEDRGQWTVLGTIFFLTHLATTIGYGNSHPQTPLGQFATIIFALMGIPIMGYTLAQVARMNVKTSVYLIESVSSAKVNTYHRQMAVLWSLLAVFLFGGAYMYSVLEPWSYWQSLYFCFVTLSTVGFGDFLPSSVTSKTFSIFYMIFGLGVCASIIALLTGLVAESHGNIDSFLNQKIQENCSDCCCCREADPEFTESQRVSEPTLL